MPLTWKDLNSKPFLVCVAELKYLFNLFSLPIVAFAGLLNRLPGACMEHESARAWRRVYMQILMDLFHSQDFLFKLQPLGHLPDPSGLEMAAFCSNREGLSPPCCHAD